MKKTWLLLIFIVFIPSLVSAQGAGIKILNSEVVERINDEEVYYFYQGQTVVVALDEGLENNKEEYWIQAFLSEERYSFNSQRLAYVGVKIDMMPGEYLACLSYRCSDNDRKNELRVRILKTNFPKTRTAKFTSEPQQRKDSQKKSVERAFHDNESDEDFTGGNDYIDPMIIPRDVIDAYGLIYKNNNYLAHFGVDLRTKIGESVRSVNRGKVALVARLYRFEGNMVIISHGSGVFSVYMHLSKFGQIEVEQKDKVGKNVKTKRELRVGDMVERGQVIGFSGETGRGVREPHLHFNIKIRKDYVDPIFFLDKAGRVKSR